MVSDSEDDVLALLDALDKFQRSEPTSNPGDLLDSHGYPTELALNNILTFVGSPKEFVEYVDSIWAYGLLRVYEITNDLGHQVMEVSMVTGGWSGNESVVGAVEQTMFSFAFWQMSQRGGLFVYEVPVAQWEEHWPSIGTYEHAMAVKDA